MERIKINIKGLKTLLQALQINLDNDETFVICGNMNSYTNKQGEYIKGIIELRKEFEHKLKNLNDEDIKKFKKKIYAKCKQRIGNRFYTLDNAIKQVNTRFARWIGLWIPQGYIVVDADDLDTSQKILDYLEENKIDTPIIKTPNGYQFIFKYNGDTKQAVKGVIGLGVKVDYRCANKGYIVLPLNTPNREIYSNNNVVADMPKAFLPVKKDENIQKNKSKNRPKQANTRAKKVKNLKNEEREVVKATFKEGSRNDSLYRYLCGYINNTQLREYNNLLMFATGVNKLKCIPPLDDEEVETIVKSVIDNYTPPEFLNDKGRVIPYRLAQTIASQKNCISDKISSYIYNGQAYEEVEVNYFKQIDELVENKELIKSSTIKEVTDLICNLTRRGTIENSRDYINFKNGLFNVKTGELIPHTKDIVTLGTINANYDPKKADITGTNFERYLKTSLDEELIPVVQEMLGVCLYPLTNKIHYFYVLVGEGRNGKGVLLDIILNIIPPNLRSGISMKGYDERFTNSQIKGKQINICTDDPTTRLEGIGNLKSVTAGEGIFVERKGIDGEMIKAILTHISAINVLPSLQEKSNALFDRMIVIPFKNSFGTEEEVAKGEKDFVRDVNLKNEIIKNELDIVVNWGLEGLLRVMDNGYKFTITESVKEKIEEYREEVDSVRAWIKGEIIPVQDPRNADFRKDKELYRWYKEYCEEEDIMPVGKKAFKEGCRRHLRKYWKNIDRYDCYSVLRDYNGIHTKNTKDEMVEVEDSNCPF